MSAYILLLDTGVCLCGEVRGQCQMTIVFHPTFLNRDLSPNPELTSLARLAAQQAPKDPPVCFSGAGKTDTCCHTRLFNVDVGGLNSGP